MSGALSVRRDLGEVKGRVVLRMTAGGRGLSVQDSGITFKFKGEGKRRSVCFTLMFGSQNFGGEGGGSRRMSQTFKQSRDMTDTWGGTTGWIVGKRGARDLGLIQWGGEVGDCGPGTDLTNLRVERHFPATAYGFCGPAGGRRSGRSVTS